ncbi:MAG: glycogen/starch/alpha-glucan phosphorylase [Oscillospiraceae bacterium]|nr:glycogen/starch/alpha-glucan phosphorylase [Oscillospiraceae bacterium]MCL2278743.1 glycogen/starch/alpha-glucan phosphorylase [Oscillospiraceae bacterium]
MLDKLIGKNRLKSTNYSDKEIFSMLFLDKLEVLRGVTLSLARKDDIYVALASLVRDQMMKNWTRNIAGTDNEKKKQVYYFSLEFLLGPMLERNILALGLGEICKEAMKDLDIDLQEIYAVELDPGLGNGGLGRLAACFMDSLAFLGIPGNGCSIRYKYGLFEQKIVDGHQIEMPDNWLRNESVWEIKKPNKAVLIKYYGKLREEQAAGRLLYHHENFEPVIAMPYDVPLQGFESATVNTLRLWSAESTQQFDYGAFSGGDYLNAVSQKYSAEAISEVLYPDDSNYQNRILRLKQQYFFVSAGLQSILNHYKQNYGDVRKLNEYVSVHINDTHPALAVPELMRLLMDEEGLGWDEAWDITVKTISYTNHTILPEALEKWAESSFSELLPRIYMIVCEINARWCAMLHDRYNGDMGRVASMAIINHGEIQMAYLAIVGSHAINGVAKVHSEILKNELFHGFYEIYPERFNNKTNGIAHRRWVLKANPELGELISETIGPEWLREPLKLKLLDEKGAVRDKGFLERLREIKREDKVKLAKIIKESNGIIVSPDSIFDVQIKRIHAYKRQLLFLLNIIDLYYDIIDNPTNIVPRTFILAGKAAPSYHFAKEIIKFTSVVADKINNDPRVKDNLKVVFLENYRVSLAEKIFPATDLSEQISTASMEASGTGNMKFMMNGAVTIGTYDGANIEIFEAVGKGNYISFGLTVPEVFELRRNHSYNSRELVYGHERLKRIIHDFINSDWRDALKADFPYIFDSLITHNDEFFVLKDFDAYVQAQITATKLYKDVDKWSVMSAMNIAHSGCFSSDEVIRKYAKEIWNV